MWPAEPHCRPLWRSGCRRAPLVACLWVGRGGSGSQAAKRSPPSLLHPLGPCHRGGRGGPPGPARETGHHWPGRVTEQHRRTDERWGEPLELAPWRVLLLSASCVGHWLPKHGGRENALGGGSLGSLGHRLQPLSWLWLVQSGFVKDSPKRQLSSLAVTTPSHLHPHSRLQCSKLVRAATGCWHQGRQILPVLGLTLACPSQHV